MSDVQCKWVVALLDAIDLLDALGTEKKWLWCVYWYEEGNYEGHGRLVACDLDGNLHVCDLGHCSCYGPGDGGVAYWGTLVDFLTSENVLDTFEHGIGAKIKELCEIIVNEAKEA